MRKYSLDDDTLSNSPSHGSQQDQLMVNYAQTWAKKSVKLGKLIDLWNWATGRTWGDSDECEYFRVLFVISLFFSSDLSFLHSHSHSWTLQSDLHKASCFTCLCGGGNCGCPGHHDKEDTSSAALRPLHNFCSLQSSCNTVQILLVAR